MPQPNTAVISITDPGEDLEIESGWGPVLQISFVDGGYDETVIRAFGVRFRDVYSDYLDKDKALRIRRFIDNLIDRPNITVLHVHCRAGQSRSAAVASYASKRFGIEIDADLSKSNQSVLLLLNHPTYFDNALNMTVPTTGKDNLPNLWSVCKVFIAKVFKK